ncbi:outer membrane lipoprotein-sorting protein [Scopulibacillus daqui]|uniref:Outer membrane lipoprotein-sorting protein n=1 Tax=Scopulibacillus daqui TaxID=1469162 RepID=A0ABS2Q3S1_9BACL|nr:lipoprotein BA_5634 family protein [Scopulibacillus daqui]MBM7646856.1 outer membrane lipoprotein-sorting protein [Scopulibacillus daqui]
MKRMVGMMFAALLLISALAGCSFSSKANGIILYGDHKQVQDGIAKYKSELKSSDIYKVKITKANDKKMMVMDKSTAEALMKKGLLKEVDSSNDTKAISSLPDVTDHNGLLFAKDQKKDIKLNGTDLKYKGNIIIGDARVYTDMFAVVADSDWPKVNGKEKAVGIMHFNKDPKEEIGSIKQVDWNQLVKIKN